MLEVAPPLRVHVPTGQVTNPAHPTQHAEGLTYSTELNAYDYVLQIEIVYTDFENEWIECLVLHFPHFISLKEG